MAAQAGSEIEAEYEPLELIEEPALVHEAELRAEVLVAERTNRFTGRAEAAFNERFAETLAVEADPATVPPE